MKLGGQAIAGVLGILACAGLIWAAIALAGLALVTVLTPIMGLAAAASLTAVLLLIVPVGVVLIYGRRSATTGRNRGADGVLSAIAEVAKERPFLAVIGAALFGAAEILLSRRRRERKS